MQVFSSLFVGALLGGGFVYFSRRQSAQRSRYIFAAGLAVVAAIYAAFSLNAGPAVWVLVELGGVAVFATIAVAGYRRSLLIIAIGWSLHVAWDLLHQMVEAVRFVPAWYPSLCIGFDVVVGAYLFVVWSRESKQVPP